MATGQNSAATGGPLRVLLADPFPIFRTGMRAVLEAADRLEVVDQQETGDEALRSIRALEPDVAVLGVSLPGLSGLHLTRSLRDERHRTGVVLVSHQGAGVDLQAAFEAGAHAYLEHDSTADELEEAIRAAANGHRWVSPKLRGVLASVASRKRRPAPLLTEREQEVLGLVAQGMSSREVAAALGLSPKTVGGHQTSLLSKLKLGSVASLVKYAIESGRRKA